MGLGKFGLETNCRTVRGTRLFQLALCPEGVADIVVGLGGIVGIEPQGLRRNSAIASSSFGPGPSGAQPRLLWAPANSGAGSECGLEVSGNRPRPASPVHGASDAEVVVGLRVVGPGTKSFAGTAPISFVLLALCSESEAEAVVDTRVVGLEPQGFAVLGDRLLELPLVAQDEAEVVVGRGVIRLERGSASMRRAAIASSTFPGRTRRCQGCWRGQRAVWPGAGSPQANFGDRFVQRSLF